MANGLPCRDRWSATRSGVSATHGRHQVAHTLTRTHWPRCPIKTESICPVPPTNIDGGWFVAVDLEAVEIVVCDGGGDDDSVQDPIEIQSKTATAMNRGRRPKLSLKRDVLMKQISSRQVRARRRAT